jgi:predicted methyltransferase
MKTDVTLLEIDDRIINNFEFWNQQLYLNTKIIKYDAVKPILTEIKDGEKFDIFCVNPPYGSKNYLYGAKVWISRCLKHLKVGGEGLIILPIDYKYPWSLQNMIILQEFLTDNNCIIFKIDKDVHLYENKKDKELYSSNIWIKKLENSEALIEEAQDNLYR